MKRIAILLSIITFILLFLSIKANGSGNINAEKKELTKALGMFSSSGIYTNYLTISLLYKNAKGEIISQTITDVSRPIFKSNKDLIETIDRVLSKVALSKDDRAFLTKVKIAIGLINDNLVFLKRFSDEKTKKAEMSFLVKYEELSDLVRELFYNEKPKEIKNETKH